ncbi:MAG: cytochrome c oxidase subunit II [Gammaproteobacteria bacterium]|nr:cytochrome c oxidase subunit II [Gammaproteobacteria bacterium]
MFMLRLAKLRHALLRVTSAVSLFFVSTLAFAEYGFNLQPPVTPIAREILNLHNAIMIVCAVIFVIVFGAMFYAVFAHRKSRGHKASDFDESTKVEIVWTVVPFLILVGMAIPSTATLLKMDDVTESDLTIKITGYQWKWHYEYMDKGVSFFSVLATPRDEIGRPMFSSTGFKAGDAKNANYLLQVDKPLVLPVDQKIRFLVTTNDVLHAWWVPQIGIKKDGIPGFINQMWARIEQPGTYRGQCAELCGKDHGFMPIVLDAVSEQDFNAWLEQEKAMMAAAAAGADREWAKAELLEKGKETYDKVCASCHQPNGQGIAGVFPAIAGSKVATGPLDEHLHLVMAGKPGTAMQAFGPQLDDVALAAVITYQRNAFGNNTGDLVQPSRIKALRK